MKTETHIKPTKKNQELEQSQVFVVLCQEWPRCCARNGELKSVVCLGRSSRLRSYGVVLARSLMQVRVKFEKGGRVATGTRSCATEAQRHEKDKTWALLGKRCPASPLP